MKPTLKRTPQRSLLLLSLLALIWGAALVVAAGLDAEPALLLTVWGAGAALLVLLAFYLGLSFRLDLLQVQQALRDALAAPDAQASLKFSLGAFWQPLIDAASAARQPVEDVAREKAKMAAQTAAHLVALQSALEAERAQGSAWQRQVAQAQAELVQLRKQAQDAARAVAAAEAAAAAAALPDPREAIESVAREQREQQQAAWAELSSLASSLAAEVEAQIGAAARRETTAQSHAAARAEKLAQAEAGQKRSAEQLAQTAEALALLGLNLRLQLSHLAASPSAAELLEQTEADLDALLGAINQPRAEPGPAVVPDERPASAAGQDPGPADALAPLLARLRAVSESAAQAVQKKS
jgi:hypothetical protein